MYFVIETGIVSTTEQLPLIIHLCCRFHQGRNLLKSVAFAWYTADTRGRRAWRTRLALSTERQLLCGRYCL